jgi:glycosyltransferase involved in cell wall biosynthesis
MAYECNELISVIVPAYNAEDFIDQTLSSALAQTYRNLEIIVIDDGSSDRTAELVKARADQDFRIRLIRQKNSGVAAARNLGIREARGKFIAPLDADDLWHPEKLQRQFEAMRAGGQSVGLVYTWCSSVDANGRIINRAASDVIVMDFAYETLLYFNFIISASVPLIRKDCLLEVGGYDQNLRAQDAEGCEDLKLYLAIAEKWKISAVPAFLVGYRMTANSMTSNVRRMKRSHELVLADARSRHPELPERIFRWSRGFNYFWMGIVALKRRQTSLAMELLTTAIINDPGMLLRIRWQLMRFIRPAWAFAVFTLTGRPSLRGQMFIKLPAPDFERVPTLDKWPSARRIDQIGTQLEVLQ